MDKQSICFKLNGEEVDVQADPGVSLLSVLRDVLGMSGTKEGCGKGECGACTVVLDGLAVNACLVPVGKVSGKTVLTVEGLAVGGRPHALQQAFVDEGAVQCGFCTPGMLMTAYAFLQRCPDPSADEVKTAISGNLCRCTGYVQIEKAILAAAKSMRGKGDVE
jgi:carbon-monoxide dehydrogenase small subunit